MGVVRNMVEEKNELKVKIKEASGWKRFKVNCKMRHYVRMLNRGAFKREVDNKDIMKMADCKAFPIVLDKPIYMTEAGFSCWPESGRIYNEDHSGFVMIGKGTFFAFVAIANGQVTFFGRHNSDLKRFDWSLTKYIDLLHYFGNEPYSVYEDLDVVPEPGGYAGELLASLKKLNDAD